MNRTAALSVGLFVSQSAGQVCTQFEPQELIGEGAIAFASAGFSVAAEGDLAIIGAYSDDRVQIAAGSVAVYRKAGGVWVQEDDLLPDPDEAARGDWMGRSVATDGERIVVGVPFGLVDGAKSGRVLVYRSDPVLGWVVEQTLVAPDGRFDDQFGASVAIDSDAIVVGAPGRDFFTLEDMGGAYVFREDGAGWVFEDLLLGFSTQLAQGGFAVDVDMPLVVMGSPRDGSPGLSDTGRAWAFEFSESGWSAPADLPAEQPEAGAWYGHAVAIDDRTAAVGAPFVDGPIVGPSNEVGRVSVFRFEFATWNLTQSIDGPMQSGDQFLGDSLDLRGDTLAVGLPGRETRRGAVQIYTSDDQGLWSLTGPAFTTPGGLPAVSFFGNSVALSGDALIAGSDRTDIPANNAGSAWAYRICDCPADITGDDKADFFDVAAFLSRYNDGDPQADLSEPFGVLNFFDIAAYIGFFNAGCP
ncbi:MAG: GC-type dockerin domain-anchored protein [Planctomycetota bacterium]